MRIIFISGESRKNKNTKGAFYPEKFQGYYNIVVNDADIYLEQGKLTIHFSQSTLYDELVHYLDFKYQIKNNNLSDKARGNVPGDKQNDSQAMKAYLNSPVEFNAWFMQHIMPNIQRFIVGLKMPIRDFAHFKSTVMESKEIHEFYRNLTPENKQRFMKRLGSYWVSLQQHQQQTKN